MLIVCVLLTHNAQMLGFTHAKGICFLFETFPAELRGNCERVPLCFFHSVSLKVFHFGALCPDAFPPSLSLSCLKLPCRLRKEKHKKQLCLTVMFKVMMPSAVSILMGALLGVIDVLESIYDFISLMTPQGNGAPTLASIK